MTEIHVAELRVQDVVDILNKVGTLSFIDKAMFESIGEQLQIIHKKRFDKQIDPDGQKWAELDPDYALLKREQAKYQKILQYDGGLHDTLTAQADDYGVKFGSNKVYAANHHYGGTVKARPFIGINDDDIGVISEEIEEAYNIWLSNNT